MNTTPLPNQRADKYLHHVRVFKTRSLATQACGKGQVTMAGRAIKSSRDLVVGDVLEVERGDLRLRLRVLAFSAQRVGPPKVAELCENLTPAEWYERAAALRKEREMVRPREHEMVAKPNKQQLRQLRAWKEQQEPPSEG